MHKILFVQLVGPPTPLAIATCLFHLAIVIYCSYMSTTEAKPVQNLQMLLE